MQAHIAWQKDVTFAARTGHLAQALCEVHDDDMVEHQG